MSGSTVLKMSLLRLENAVFGTVDSGTVDSVCGELDQVTASRFRELAKVQLELDGLRTECRTLHLRRDALLAEISGLSLEIEEAKEKIEEGNEQGSLLRVEKMALEKKHVEITKLWENIQRFQNGNLAKDFERKMLEFTELMHKIEVIQDRFEEELNPESVEEGREDSV